MKSLTPKKWVQMVRRLYLQQEVEEVHWLIGFRNWVINYNRNDIDVLYTEFLKVADRKKEVEDEDLHALAKSMRWQWCKVLLSATGFHRTAVASQSCAFSSLFSKDFTMKF